jgi:quercetin dioxygenase-like cupin family protein
MRRSITLLVVAAAVAGLTTTASASPPIGVITYRDYSRGQAMEAGSTPISPGRDLVISSYRLAPGADSGWGHRNGLSVFAVTSGTLTVRSADSCTTREYTPGEAAVLTPGLHRLSNAGGQPVAFSGGFLDTAGTSPFLGGADAAPPGPCAGFPGHNLPTAPSGVEVLQSSTGAFVGPDAYRNSAHGHHAGAISIEAGNDVYVVSYRGEPYASAGWMTHRPALGIITKGTLTYYEAHDGRCVKSGEFSAGQAYVHAAPVTHLPVNEGPGPVEAIFVYFNLPHNANPLPVAGNQTDAVNWGPLPPGDCPRLK